MANATNVNLEWLATGRGPMRHSSDTSATDHWQALRPERLEDLKTGAQALVRLVHQAGADPIPADLRDELLGASVSKDQIEEPAPEYAFRHLEIVEVAAAAGGGAAVYDETVTGHLAFRRDWLDRHAIDPTQANVISVAGESMAPTLPNGCSILVDRGKRRRQSGRIYALRTGDGLVVKRLHKKNRRWQLVSDNPDWKPVPWDQEVELIGEVVWAAIQPR